MTKKIGLIIGSTRPSRISPSIASWLQAHVAQPGLTIDLIDLKTVNLPFLDEEAMPSDGNYQLDHTKAWSTLIQGYDGFILLFPQYNWGYPAPLKNALDTLYAEWRGKPVSLVSYGGHGGFQAALGMQLVVRGLKMPIMTNNLRIDLKKPDLDEAGQFIDPATALAPYEFDAHQLGAEFIHRLGD
ncbi:flavoprotein [Levilactobacillus senmaizukei DSM 21775 = NBRC 103853]|uniref:Flavoprotein n=1 Tax=Levilactobacillus senmaizukei DSM 21775 = NBRC 103853 TaxID=1423803 RepID=A0A0R2DMR6_9LACO|nr:NADPH-dependent FMN reductase [Levilactobacillus senmaizukei]KRN01564.1 flavoprotein [Levilactobacillus senmaizukei DSM 21775 = NBRC 103853]